MMLRVPDAQLAQSELMSQLELALLNCVRIGEESIDRDPYLRETDNAGQHCSLLAHFSMRFLRMMQLLPPDC